MNPCKGVRQFKEVARDKYVSDEEYNCLYAVSPPIVKVAMELAYLCCARQGDVLALKKNQIVDTGIYIKQGKTGVAQIKAWSVRLVGILKLAEQLPLKDGASSVFILHQRSGSRYTRDGFNSRWNQAREDARKAYPHLSFDFTFHDLKAKGISDLEGTIQEKQSISGHKNASQTARYDRKTKIVPAVDGQNIRK